MGMPWATLRCSAVGQNRDLTLSAIGVRDDEYKELQSELVFNPAAGAIIPHSGGLRKVRWRSATKGKRGGIRVIYYWYVDEKELFMLLAYGKGEKDDLTPKELKTLRSLIQETLK